MASFWGFIFPQKRLCLDVAYSIDFGCKWERNSTFSYCFLIAWPCFRQQLIHLQCCSLKSKVIIKFSPGNIHLHSIFTLRCFTVAHINRDLKALLKNPTYWSMYAVIILTLGKNHILFMRLYEYYMITKKPVKEHFGMLCSEIVDDLK